MTHYLGDYELIDISGVPTWQPPNVDDCISAVDLRPTPVQGKSGRDPKRASGVFSYATPQDTRGNNLIHLGDSESDVLDKRASQAWKSKTGIDATGDTVSRTLFNSLGQQSDPLGDDTAPTLMPTKRGQFDLWMGGKRNRFAASPRHQNMALVRVRHDFAKVWNSETNKDVARKHLQGQIEKYRRQQPDDWSVLVPGHLVDDVRGPIPHDTDVADDFDRSDEDLDTSSDWDNATNGGEFKVYSNGVTRSGSGLAKIVFQQAFANDDHSAEIYWTDNNDAFWASARTPNDGTTHTYYYAWMFGTYARVHKMVTGSTTYLGQTGGYGSAGTIRCDCNGSTIIHNLNGSDVTSVSDSAITGNLYTGLGTSTQNGGAAMGDDFAASDGVTGGGGILYTQLERDHTRGVRRGMWQGGS